MFTCQSVACEQARVGAYVHPDSFPPARFALRPVARVRDSKLKTLVTTGGPDVEYDRDISLLTIALRF